MLMIFACSEDCQADVTYNPNNLTLTIVIVRNPIYRNLCCQSKERTYTTNINTIKDIYKVPGCFKQKLYVSLSSNGIITTDSLFNNDQLDTLIYAIKPTVDLNSRERERQRNAANATPQQTQQIVVIVANADEYINANPNAQIHVVQQGLYNPPAVLARQQQQQQQQLIPPYSLASQLTQTAQSNTVSYPVTTNDYDASIIKT
ncbi:MAG: hypothetical protein EZS28_009192 [Streblomastix strix]|uniref:Uncharacterized protein n=1 Tax=Streblomastix strix TaxID=222440 RepID=A0A5J4WK98_9EUKA|nr:MAG: hypothetical protein EZS28_009192 [Streblomastix strix]